MRTTRETIFDNTSYWQVILDGLLAGPTMDVESIAARCMMICRLPSCPAYVHRRLAGQCRVHRWRYRVRAHQDNLVIAVSGWRRSSYYSAVPDGSSGILSLTLLAWGLQLFSNFLRSHIVKTTCAGWNLTEYYRTPLLSCFQVCVGLDFD